ncbi:hypothetical protein ABBQ32_001718 [Trebouxia sp. C0010 RCD-2024]
MQGRLSKQERHTKDEPLQACAHNMWPIAANPDVDVMYHSQQSNAHLGALGHKARQSAATLKYFAEVASAPWFRACPGSAFCKMTMCVSHAYVQHQCVPAHTSTSHMARLGSMRLAHRMHNTFC